MFMIFDAKCGSNKIGLGRHRPYWTLHQYLGYYSARMVAQSCGIDYYAVILRVNCLSITTPSQVSMRDTVGQRIGTYGFARNALYTIHTSAGFIAFQGK